MWTAFLIRLCNVYYVHKSVDRISDTFVRCSRCTQIVDRISNTFVQCSQCTQIMDRISNTCMQCSQCTHIVNRISNTTMKYTQCTQIMDRVPNISVLCGQCTQRLNSSLMNVMFQMTDCLHCGHYRCSVHTQNNKMVTKQNSYTQQKPLWIKTRESSEN